MGFCSLDLDLLTILYMYIQIHAWERWGRQGGPGGKSSCLRATYTLVDAYELRKVMSHRGIQHRKLIKQQASTCASKRSRWAERQRRDESKGGQFLYIHALEEGGVMVEHLIYRNMSGEWELDY